MGEYFLSNLARADLTEIWLYVAEDRIETADRLIDTLHGAFPKLAGMPGMGHRRDELASESLRVWPVGQYLIIYRPETKPLEIVRVVSGYRDLAALFQE